MSQEAYDLEAADGIRMPWNVWPRSKVEALKCVLPFSAFYSPVKPTNNLQVRHFIPSICHVLSEPNLSLIQCGVARV